MGTGLIAFTAASLFWIRTRPTFSEEELAEAARSVDALQREPDGGWCHRPALGDASEATAPSLAALIDPSGEYVECLREAAREDVREATQGIVGTPDDEHRRWIFDVSNPWIPYSATPTGRIFITAQHPPYPAGQVPSAYGRVEEACEGLADAVTALATRDGQCSPFSPGSPGWMGLHPEFIDLSRAIGIVARARARNGDLEGALTLLVHGVTVVQDLRRGPTTLFTALASIAAEMEHWATFNTLLMSAPGPTAAVRAELTELIDRLIDASPHPHDTFVGQAMAVPEYASTNATSHERAFRQMVTSEEARGVGRWCSRDQDPIDCFSAIPAVPEEEEEPGLLVEAWNFIRGPNAEFGARQISSMVDYDLNSYRHAYLPQLSTSPVAVHLVKVMLALSGERQRGVCPTEADIDERLLDIPFTRGSVETSQFHGPQYQVAAPLWAIGENPGSMVFYAVCPAVGGRWVPMGAD